MRDLLRANDRVVAPTPSRPIEEEEVAMVDDYLRYMQAKARDKASKAYIRRSLDQQLREKDLLNKQQLYLSPEKLGEYTLSNKLISPHLQQLYRDQILKDESQIARDQKLLTDEYRRLHSLI